MNLFETLNTITQRPVVWSKYTAGQLWTDAYIATQMLNYHLNPDVDAASRNEKFIDESVAWIVSRFNLDDHSDLIDFGCGPGLYTSRFAQKGVNVTGVDFSATSIDYARKVAGENALQIEYIEENYLTFETDKKFNLITMIFCDFCALSPAQRFELLEKIKNMLTDDGSILLDVYTDKAFEKRTESSNYEHNLMNGFWAPHDYYGFLNIFKYMQERVVLDKYTIVEPGGERVVYNWLQYFSLEAFTREVEAHGLYVDSVYDDVRGSTYTGSDEMAVILRRA